MKAEEINIQNNVWLEFRYYKIGLIKCANVQSDPTYAERYKKFVENGAELSSFALFGTPKIAVILILSKRGEFKFIYLKFLQSCAFQK